MLAEKRVGHEDSDLANSIVREVVEGIGGIVGKYGVYQAAHAAVLHVQNARRVLALSLVTLVLGILGYYATLKFGNSAVGKSASGSLQSIQATFVLAVIYLLLYFVAKRSKSYEREEIDHLNSMLPYEEKYANSTGPGHKGAADYRDRYWAYSQVDMAVFGCLIATSVTAFYDLLH